MNYFGLRRAFAMPRRDGVEILEDHSHDPSSPWAASSAADFCVASLRKTIPLPDGGVLWSPLGHALPPEPHQTMRRTQAAATKLSAMILKGMYFEGHRIGKAWFRDSAQRGERGLAVPGVSAMSHVARAILDSSPVATWRSARAANHIVLSSLLAQVGWARVLAPADHDSVSLSCVVLVDSAQLRERARRYLIAANVFPAVLWPLEQTVMPVGHEARDLSRRMLSLHCDRRYGTTDMLRIGEILAGMAGA